MAPAAGAENGDPARDFRPPVLNRARPFWTGAFKLRPAKDKGAAQAMTPPAWPQRPAVDPPRSRTTKPVEPMSERVVLDDVAIRRALMRIAHEIVERNDDPWTPLPGRDPERRGAAGADRWRGTSSSLDRDIGCRSASSTPRSTATTF